MKDIPELPNKASMKAVVVRAKLVARRHSPDRSKRSHIRQIEQVAKDILEHTRDGACATLAKNVLDLANCIDNVGAEIYPVFAMIDAKIKEQQATLKYDETGYWLFAANGHLLSNGPTFKGWLIDHVKRFGDQETLFYDSGSE